MYISHFALPPPKKKKKNNEKHFELFRKHFQNLKEFCYFCEDYIKSLPQKIGK